MNLNSRDRYDWGMVKVAMLLIWLYFSVSTTLAQPIRRSKNKVTIPNGSNITAINVDARIPNSTKIQYELTGNSLQYAVFYAPGLPNGIHLPGPIQPGIFFSPVFNQRDVLTGNQINPSHTSNITLIYYSADSDGSISAKRNTITVTRVSKSQTESVLSVITLTDSDIGFNVVLAPHELTEYYSTINYSIPSVAGSKLVRAGYTHAGMVFAQQQQPTTWGEKHRYDDATGAVLPVVMVEGTWPEIQPNDGRVRLKKFQQVDTHLQKPNNSDVDGQGSATVFYGTGTSLIPTLVVNGTVTVNMP